MIRCEICNNPRPMLHNEKQCLTCGGKLFEDKDWEKLIQIKNCPTEIADDIWNAAIEAAAKAAEECGDYNPASYYVDDIKRLKK